jgi:hypothetical protein
MKVVYVACVLTKTAQKLLFEYISSFIDIPVDWKKFGHHMTVEFNNAEKAMQEGYFDDNIKLGDSIHLKATHYKMDKKGLALVIERDNRLKISNKVPHITVAVSPDTKPFYSNKMLESGKWIKLSEPQIFDSTLLVVV